MTEYLAHLYYHQPIKIPVSTIVWTETKAFQEAYNIASVLIQNIEESEIMESSYIKNTNNSYYIANIHYYITRIVKADNPNEALDKASNQVTQEIKHIPDIRKLDSSNAVPTKEYN